MSTYHRRVYRCEARQYDGSNFKALLEWAGLEGDEDVGGGAVVALPPSFTPAVVLKGDWFVKIDGTVQVCEGTVFEREWVPAIESMPPDDYRRTVGAMEKEMVK